MPDPNPTAVIAECIEKSKATDDPELIGEYIAEALATLQIEESEEDAFNMLGSAIVDAVADDPAHKRSELLPTRGRRRFAGRATGGISV